MEAKLYNYGRIQLKLEDLSYIFLFDMLIFYSSFNGRKQMNKSSKP